MEKHNNPFIELGITREEISGLSDDEINGIVKKKARALLRTRHTDVGGSLIGTQHIIKAYKSLDFVKDPVSFKYWKSEYLKVPSRPRSKLMAEISGYREKNSDLVNLIVQSMLDDDYTGSDNGLFLELPNACTLRVYDSWLDLQTRRVRWIRESPRLLYELKHEHGYLVRLRGDLAVNKDPHLVSNKKLVGTVGEQVVNGYGNIMHVLLMTQLNENNIRTVKFSRDGKFYPTKAFVQKFDNRVSPEAYKSIAHLVSPKLSNPSYLFSVNREQNQVYFSLEGKITGIVQE